MDEPPYLSPRKVTSPHKIEPVAEDSSSDSTMRKYPAWFCDSERTRLWREYYEDCCDYYARLSKGILRTEDFLDKDNPDLNHWYEAALLMSSRNRILLNRNGREEA